MHQRGRVRFLTLAIASLATSAPMFAQMPAYMHALTMPPANVGTCMPARTSTGRDSVGRAELCHECEREQPRRLWFRYRLECTGCIFPEGRMVGKVLCRYDSHISRPSSGRQDGKTANAARSPACPAQSQRKRNQQRKQAGHVDAEPLSRCRLTVEGKITD